MTRDQPSNHSDHIQHLVGEVLNVVEPIPKRALSQAYEAIQLRALNEELATLVYDSSREGDLIPTRGTEGPARLMSFTNDHLSIELTLLADGSTLIGELNPVDVEEVDVESDGGTTSTIPVDEFGRFRATTPPGPVRLRVNGKLLTPWITR